MTRKELEAKREHARLLYMQGVEQKTIAEATNTSQQTISKWVKEGNWQTLRAGQQVTRTELVNKILGSIDTMLTEAQSNGDPNLIAKLHKTVRILNSLDKKATVVDAIEVFMQFGRWLTDKAMHDRLLTAELIKTINKYQNDYINEQVQTGNG